MYKITYSYSHDKFSIGYLLCDNAHVVYDVYDALKAAGYIDVTAWDLSGRKIELDCIAAVASKGERCYGDFNDFGG